MIDSIVVIGGGIAGTTVASMLADRGKTVALAERPVKLDRIVGESLLPAVVPFLRTLGIEDEVRGIAMLKPGIAFVLPTGRTLRFALQDLSGMAVTYSYNVPRPAFDEVLRNKARSAGVRVVNCTVGLERNGDRVLLDDDTLRVCGLNKQPDLVIDCSGRSRLLHRTFRLNGTTGPRADTCLFAHYEGIDLGVKEAGFAVMTVMQFGWCWRIPLPGRISVGVIADTHRLQCFGKTADDRLDSVLVSDPLMREAVSGGKRVTDVAVFNNYQWVGERFSGENWAIVGDAAGFVDPSLSSGVLLAVQGATSLVEAITGRTPPKSGLLAWEQNYRDHLVMWQEFVDYFYDGRLFAMIMQGEDHSKRRWLGPLNHHIKRHFAASVLGARLMSPYSRRLVRFLIKNGIRDYDPKDWAVAD